MTTRIEPRLSARMIAQRGNLAQVRVFGRLRSTNAAAARLVERGELALPAAVVTRQQTAGCGQGGNAWYSDAGSLTATFVLPAIEGVELQQLPLRAGLAVRSVLARYVAPESLAIKWPNDVLAGGLKIAGILCRRVQRADLVGVGVNISTSLAAAPADVQQRAVALHQLAASCPSVDQVLIELALAIGRVWAADDWHDRINEVHALTGEVVRVATRDGVVQGLCRGVSEQGGLLIQTERGIEQLWTGHVIGG